MELQTVSSRLSSILVLYDMHTIFFESALEGISDIDAHRRLDTKAIHIAWLTGSLVQERFELANLLGADHKQKADDLFRDHKGIQDNQAYPPLDNFINDWKLISPILKEELANADDDKLNSSFEMMPGQTMTNFDLIAFSTYREANCIGQIALWRRLLGYEAMKYM